MIEGVSYIYLEDREGRISFHTFTPQFPPGLASTNRAYRLSKDERVRIYARVTFPGTLGSTQDAMDIAAPVAGGALGTVHVGMGLEAIEGEVGLLRASMAGSGAVIAAIGVILCLLLTNAIAVRPIRALTNVTGEIVREGDLTQRIDVRSSDEIAWPARGDVCCHGGQTLREITHGLRDSTGLLADSVTQLGASTTEQVQVVTRQATALQETQATAQEIKQTSLLAAGKAEAVLKYAERADVIRLAGESAVQQSLHALTDIRAQVNEIAERIAAVVGARTMRIGEVTQTVKDLADQSNMLALNAAIEAVHSGQHGKGFTVVAQQIRSLADQSIQATFRVREMLDDIGSAMRSTVSITEKGAQRIDSGLSEVRTLGEKLTDLSTIVKDKSAAVRQIGTVVGQQDAGISQIFSAVSDQTKLMEDTTRRIDATESVVKVIGNVSNRLVQIVDQFKV